VTGWLLGDVANGCRCESCGDWSTRVWRHWAGTTSAHSICERCADLVSEPAAESASIAI